MLFRHYVRVVSCLNTGLNREEYGGGLLSLSILNANLMVASRISCKVKSEFASACLSLQLFALWVSHHECQHLRGRCHLDNRYSKVSDELRDDTLD